MTDPALEAFRNVDFNWAIRLQDVWSNPAGDVPELHQNARRIIVEEIEHLERHSEATSPLGRFIVGDAGAGKTHLLGAIRQTLAKKGLGFILVDMTDVEDFWSTVAQGYLNSLQADYPDGRPQFKMLLEGLLQKVPLRSDIARTLTKFGFYSRDALARNSEAMLAILSKLYPTPVRRHQDTIRALICLLSRDFGTANAGMAWLQNLTMAEDVRATLHFQRPRGEPREVVRALSWIMSLAGPSVLAFDQMDPIAHQVTRGLPGDADGQSTTGRIIDRIGNGLAALRETTSRTLVVVSCLEATRRILDTHVLASSLDRFHQPDIRLSNPARSLYAALVEARLTSEYGRQGFTPPYPTWPFQRGAIDMLSQQSPRRVFQLCERHRQFCIALGRGEELQSFETTTHRPAPEKSSLHRLDQMFQSLRAEADLASLRDEANEDTDLVPLYQTALQCLLLENGDRLPEHVNGWVEIDFSGARGTKPLHGRLHIQFQNEGDREEHYCVRVLLRANASAFRSRLQTAMTTAGIHAELRFRHLTIIRFSEPPRGGITRDLIDTFKERGGRFHQPTDDEVRTLYALTKLAQRRDPHWNAWLLQRRPVSKLNFGHLLAPGSLFDEQERTRTQVEYAAVT